MLLLFSVLQWDLQEIRKGYLRGGFVIDFFAAAALPLNLTFIAGPNEVTEELAHVARILRLLRYCYYFYCCCKASDAPYGYTCSRSLPLEENGIRCLRGISQLSEFTNTSFFGFCDQNI